jgi:type IV pilus assembly protein PilM
MWFFRKKKKNFLGIDIGTSAIKIVELNKEGDKIKLANYGEVSIETASKKPFRTIEGDSLLLSDQDIAEAIKTIFNEAKITTREAFFSIPDFSTFLTFVDLPPMEEEEIQSAIQFEARRHIPLPLAEVTLDWIRINENEGNFKNTLGTKVLLVAVPHEVISQYQNIAKISDINLIALEAEIFALVRSLVKDKKGIIGLIDMGAQSTTFSIVKNGFIKATHSFDISGNELTRALAKSLNIGYEEAESLKKQYGFLGNKSVTEIISPLVDLLARDIERVSADFFQQGGEKLDKIIFAGGGALLPGLIQYLSETARLKTPIVLADPFEGLLYPELLRDNLKIMGPSYAIAVGMALRGFEKQ